MPEWSQARRPASAALDEALPDRHEAEARRAGAARMGSPRRLARGPDPAVDRWRTVDAATAPPPGPVGAPRRGLGG